MTTGLEELQHRGFLLRERGRNSDGTLGQELYVITDLPTCRPADLPTCRPADLPTCRPADLPTCRPADL
ncbi:hypothetical protein ACWC24_19255, partial [Streptomyces sp. NPDC001443]